MPAIYIGATLTKAGHIFSLRKIVLSLRIVTVFENCLSVKNRDRKWRYLEILILEFCEGIWWEIFVGGSELLNLTLAHDMPTILNGVYAFWPTFTNSFIYLFWSQKKLCQMS